MRYVMLPMLYKVGPVDNRPSTNKPYSFVHKNNFKKIDM